MLTEIYIETLLIDEELADQVWERWNKEEISDFVAARTWWAIVKVSADSIERSHYGTYLDIDTNE